MDSVVIALFSNPVSSRFGLKFIILLWMSYLCLHCWLKMYSINMLNSCSSFILISESISLVLVSLYLFFPALLSLPRFFVTLLGASSLYVLILLLYWLFLFYVEGLDPYSSASVFLIVVEIPSLAYSTIHCCVVSRSCMFYYHWFRHSLSHHILCVYSVLRQSIFLGHSHILYLLYSVHDPPFGHHIWSV